MHQATAIPNPDRSAPAMRLAASASVGVAASLVIVKVVAWVMTGSVSMLGSLTDSGLDLMASLVTLIAVRAALIPPDEDHRFGHGKAEGLASLFQAAVVAGSAVFLTFESIRALGRSQPPVREEVGIAVSLIAIVLTLALVALQRWAIRRSGSLAIRADSLHYTGDLAMNLGVIAALLLSTRAGLVWADGAAGIAIAAYLVIGSFRIGVQAVDMLMDKEFSDADRERIFNLVLGNGQVRGLHELKTRSAGLRSFIQMHIELDGDLSLYEAHLIADEVEAAVGEAFPNAEIMIHKDPVGVEGVSRTAEELS